MLQILSEWLASTPASNFISGHAWITPAVQSLHILCIAGLMGAALMINLRLLDVAGLDQSIAAVNQRHGGWVRMAALGLLLSGALLVIGEPARELLNMLFLVKMALVMVALALVWLLQHRLQRDVHAWDGTPARRSAARWLAGGSLLLWVAIISAGRWIAYIN